MNRMMLGVLAVLAGGLVWGAEPASAPAKPSAAIARPRYIPEEGPKHKWWLERHEAKLAEAKALGGDVDLVFIGDSITHGWEGHGKDVLAELRKTYTILTLGYNGDSTPNTIWRLQNGELDGYKAKCVMLLLGTNNYDRPPDYFAGMKEVVSLIRTKQPDATLLLLALFPRDEQPNGPSRWKNDQYNALVKTLADGEKVVWLDLSSRFLTPEGVLPKSLFPDSLHPLKPGYVLWKDAVLPYFKKAVRAGAGVCSADLVIYGSSPAAVSAAIKATDMGLETVIVSPARHVGGLSVSGLGFTDSGNTSAIGGLARDFYRRIYRAYQKPEAWTWQRREDFKAGGQDTKAMNHAEGTMWTFEPHVAERVFSEWMAERKVEVRRGEFLDREKGVVKRYGRIVSIRTLSGNTYCGKYFIDATYEGDLMAAAGVPYRVGREDCAEFGERWNGNQIGVLHHRHHFRDWKISPFKVPDDPSSGLCAEIDPAPPGVKGAGDRRVQAYCYRMCMTDDPRNRIPFAKPDGYDPARYELLGRCYAKGYKETFAKFDRIANHKTDTNNHGPLNADWLGGSTEWPEASYARRAELARAHKDYQMGLYHYLSTDPAVPEDVRKAMAKWGLAKDEFVDNGGWPYEIYVREGRRMIGEYTMTEHDCLGDRRHPAQGRAYGPVGMGSYCLDSHNVRRYVTAEGFVQNEGDIEVRPKKPYGVDYGAIVPRKSDCENLLVPVALSATHTAFGSIRMEPVFMLLGESAATAAAFAVRDGRAVQDVAYPELAARLRADGQVLGL